MKNLIPLMQREWLQYRFGWALLLLVPLALAVLLLSVGTIDLGEDAVGRSAPELALLVGTISLALGTTIVFVLFVASSLYIAVGTPRRDHSDRSTEFWLSLPSGHAESLAAPLLVHLLLVPAAALVLGVLVAVPVSMMAVGRVVGLGEWFALPWGTLAGGLLALTLRLLAGLPMALVWLAPLLLLAMLATAWFKRWGLPVVGVSLVVGAALAEQVFGVRWIMEALAALLRNAGLSMAGASGSAAMASGGPDGLQAMAQLPAWAWADGLAAVGRLASPGFAAAVVSAGLLFWGLVEWRRRGAGLGDA
jgi:ABC-2 type transport system permease protein